MNKLFSGFIILVFLSISSSSYASFFSVTYDDIRDKGGFDQEYLRHVSRITASGDQLSVTEREALAANPHLNYVHTLDLKGQGINDDYILTLCSNPALARLINLDLSNNEGVTINSLDAILESDVIGSIRDLPQISGKYGIPSTTVYVVARNTGIIHPDEREGSVTLIKERKEFHISYIHPVRGTATDDPVDNAVKFVESTIDR